MRFFYVLCVCLFAIAGMAQNPVIEADIIQGYATSQGVVWFVVDRNVDRIDVRLLNSDMSERSSFSFSLPSGQTASGFYFFYDHFINSDNLFEVGITYGSSTYLYNENGALLKEFAGVSYLALSPYWDGGRSVSSSVRQEDVKLLGYKMENSKLVYMLYDLPLFEGNALSSAKTEVKGAYPSPASNSVVVPFPSDGASRILSIFTQNGMLVEQLPVADGLSEYVLDVSDYGSGVYFYEVAGVRNSFVVERQ